jgi:hypothetical protein
MFASHLFLGVYLFSIWLDQQPKHAVPSHAAVRRSLAAGCISAPGPRLKSRAGVVLKAPRSRSSGAAQRQNGHSTYSKGRLAFLEKTAPTEAIEGR